MAKKEASANPANSAKQDEPATFEAALEELEALTGRMEGGEVPLDETLQLYERGTFLVGFCQRTLDAAERRIEQIARTADNGVAVEPYE